MPTVVCGICLVRSYCDGPQTTCEACVGRILDMLAAERARTDALVDAIETWRDWKGTEYSGVPAALAAIHSARACVTPKESK